MTKRPWLLALTGAGMLFCFGGMTRLPHFIGQASTYLALLSIAFALYLAAAIWTLFRRGPLPAGALAVVLAFAVLFRIPLWFTEPSLSTDVWRYLWSGRLLTHGLNPYAFRVDDPALSDLATPLWERIDHAWMATPYPPLAQGAFAFFYRLAPESPTAMQIGFTLLDGAAVGVLVWLLRRLRRPPEWALLYAWNPSVVVEAAHGAHVDALVAPLTLLALGWLVTRRHTLSAGALALAVLTKFIPALLLPLFVPRWGVWRTVLFVALVGAMFWPFADAGLGLSMATRETGLFGALGIYVGQWRTNGGLFHWLAEALQEQMSQSPLGHNPLALTRLMAAGVPLMVAAAVWVWAHAQGADASPQAIFGVAAALLSAWLLMTPALFPWYLTPLLALLPLLPLRERWSARLFAAAWVWLSAASHLSYLFYRDPLHPGEIEWVRQVEYLPLYALLVMAALAYARESRPRRSGRG